MPLRPSFTGAQLQLPADTYAQVAVAVGAPEDALCEFACAVTRSHALHAQLSQPLDHATHVSLCNLTLGRVKTPYRLHETDWGPYLQGLETILGAVFVSLFILAMNRKFRRMKD